MKTTLTAVLAAATLVLTACATAPSQDETADAKPDPRRGEKVDRISIAQRVNGFGETTRNTVVVSAGPGRDYLVEVFPGCIDLQNAQSIAFDSFSGSLRRGDSLVAFDSVFGPSAAQPRPVKCSITAIYEWNADAAAPATDDAEDTGDNAGE